MRWADGREELYDLVSDRGERRSLVADEAQLAALRQTYALLDSESRAAHWAVGHTPPIDERTESALRALGYVQ